jgi:hypothetical protein
LTILWISTNQRMYWKLKWSQEQFSKESFKSTIIILEVFSIPLLTLCIFLVINNIFFCDLNRGFCSIGRKLVVGTRHFHSQSHTSQSCNSWRHCRCWTPRQKILESFKYPQSTVPWRGRLRTTLWSSHLSFTLSFLFFFSLLWVEILKVQFSFVLFCFLTQTIQCLRLQQPQLQQMIFDHVEKLLVFLKEIGVLAFVHSNSKK